MQLLPGWLHTGKNSDIFERLFFIQKALLLLLLVPNIIIYIQFMKWEIVQFYVNFDASAI